jgi:hypothetical protein
MAGLDKDYDRVIDKLANLGALIVAEVDEAKSCELIERFKYGAGLATVALTTVDPACSIEEAFRLVVGDIQSRMLLHIIASGESETASKH